MVTGILKRRGESEIGKVFEEMIARSSKVIKRQKYTYSKCSVTTQGKTVNSRRTTPGHIIVKLLKTKDKEKMWKLPKKYRNKLDTKGQQLECLQTSCQKPWEN